MTPTTRSAFANDPMQRSAVTNGSKPFLGDVSQRSEYARRFKDIMSAMASDLGEAERLSEMQKAFIRRAATLSIQCEATEAKLAEPDTKLGDKSLDLYTRMTGNLARTLRLLGLDRVPRDITPGIEAEEPYAPPATDPFDGLSRLQILQLKAFDLKARINGIGSMTEEELEAALAASEGASA